MYTKGTLCCTQALEERFNAMIEPAVSSALAAHHAERVANLAMLMANAGREHELEGLYVAARLPMLQVMAVKSVLRAFNMYGEV